MEVQSGTRKKRSCIGCFIKGALAMLVGSLATVSVLGIVAYRAYNDDLYPGFPPQSTPLVLRGGTLFDAVDGQVREPGRIVLEGGRIACIGPDCVIPRDAMEIDATGLAILPGLIDAHVHFGAPSAENASLSLPAQLWDYARQRPTVRRGLLESGVTTIRSLGDVDTGIIYARDAIAAGELAGPRIYTAGPLLTAWGGHPAGTHYKGNPWLIQHATRQVGNPEAAREAVREIAALGVDGVKAVYGGAPGIPRMGRETLEAIVDEGHRHGLWVAVHTGSVEEVITAVEAGADSVEHGVTKEAIADEVIALMRDRGTVYVPTLAVLEAHPDILARSMANLARVRAAGVPVAAGTDTQGAGMAFGKSLHRELELLVEAGLEPSGALLAATRSGAILLRSDGDLGTVEQGKQADILLVSGKPWISIGEIRRIHAVIQAGVVAYTASNP